MVMRHRSATPSSLLIRPNLSNPKIHCQLLSNQQDNLVSLTLDILVSTQASCKHLMSMLASIGLRMGCQYFQSGVLKNLPYYLTCPATPPTPCLLAMELYRMSSEQFPILLREKNKKAVATTGMEYRSDMM